jgi:hypothetical protein
MKVVVLVELLKNLYDADANTNIYMENADDP